MKRGLYILVGAVALITGSYMIAASNSTRVAHAASSQAAVMIEKSNTFYAYVKTGETLNANFDVVALQPGADSAPAVVTVTMPGGTVLPTCTVQYTDPVGTACPFSSVASADGIAVVSINMGNDQLLHNDFGWSVAVSGGSGPITGRVWTDYYDIYQDYNTITPANMNYWYVGSTGYQYAVQLNGYWGMNSGLYADPYGLRPAQASCTSEYASVTETSYWDLSGAQGKGTEAPCDGRYHIFFESPAPDLPTTSVLATTGAAQWVIPSMVQPTLSNLALALSSSSTSRAGTITFDVANIQGASVPAVIEIDTNGNGVYGESVDRTLPVSAIQGTATISFDGKDSSGAMIPATTAINLRVTIQHAGEVHFVRSDVEFSSGGIQVNRLNGSVTGRTTIYWDDRQLDTTSPCSTTPALNGTLGVDSTGGVHGWDFGSCANPQGDPGPIGGSWGNARYIDDWTYDPVSVQAVVTVAGYTAPGVPAISLTKRVAAGANADCATAVKSVTLSVAGGVTYCYTITNTGAVALTNVRVMDDNATPGDNADDFTVVAQDLAVGASTIVSKTINITNAQMAAGKDIVNTAIATGTTLTGTTATSPQDSATVLPKLPPTPPNTGFGIVKLSSPVTVAIMGVLAASGLYVGSRKLRA